MIKEMSKRIGIEKQIKIEKEKGRIDKYSSAE